MSRELSTFKYFVLLYFIVVILNISGVRSMNQVFGRYGSVKVDIDASFNQRWGSSWPEGIRLSSNLQTSLPNVMRYSNVTGYPYATSTSRESSGINTKRARPQQIKQHPRTFSWLGDEELLITCQLSTISTNPSCTRVAPPLSWLTYNRIRAAPVTNTDSDFVEIIVTKVRVENNLQYLRSIGMSRTDIFRMLDKGPWILAFDLSSSLSKLSQDLQSCLGFNQSETKHVISHCPYLLAQYSRYKGRDICATTMILNEVNYCVDGMPSEIMRFPVILAAPPERIRGWMSLLQQYGIATSPNLFGKTLRRAPFMFYRDPPSLFEEEPFHPQMDEASTPKYGAVIHEAKDVLDLLVSYGVIDLDKIIRTYPALLLTPVQELLHRINFLVALFSSEDPSGGHGTIDSTVMDSETMSATDMFGQSSPAWTARGDVHGGLKKDQDALKKFRQLLQTYPATLSIDHKQMRSVTNALRSGGLKRFEIVFLIKSHPLILQQSPELIHSLIYFLISYCGLHKSDVVSSLIKYPTLLTSNMESLRAKVDYLYQSIGGTSTMLRRYPAYLSYDLEEYIKPRAEFLKAFNKSPAALGLHFLLKASPKDLAIAANVDVNAYKKFTNSFCKFSKKWIKTSASQL